MSHHKNARLTFARRLEMVGLISERTARKWLERYLAGGEPALADASSRPAHSPRRISESKALAIVELRRRRLTQARIATSLGVSEATVSRVLRRAGLSKLSALQPVEPAQRHEHAAPGELLHIDTKKLGVIVREGHRIHGDRRQRARGFGWEFLYVAVDDHARIGFTQMQPDERGPSAVAFLRAAVGYYASLGITVRRVLTDTAARSWRAPGETPAPSGVSCRSAPAPTGLRPTERPSASSRARCASGPTASPTTTRASAPRCWPSGSTTTNGTALMQASAACRRCPDSSLPQATTS